MSKMTDDEITAAANEIRKVLQRSTACTTDALLVCLVAGATFATDGHKDVEDAARVLQLASECVISGVVNGGFMMAARRLDS